MAAKPETRRVFEGDLDAGGHLLRFGGTTHVMGVINVSPESRNPQTVATNAGEAIALARRYQDWGADLVDVGGQSSHFDARTLNDQEEVERVCPVVEVLAADGFVVSVDTWKPTVAAAAVEAGAALVNDTGGLQAQEMRDLVETTGTGVVAVHVDGGHPHDVGDVILGDGKADDMAAGFARLLADLAPGVADRVIVDPGIAINYRSDYEAYTRLQMDVIRKSSVFAGLKRPLLVPIPRKRDIHWVTSYISLALEYDADIIRVHDVAIAADLTRLWGRKVPR